MIQNESREGGRARHWFAAWFGIVLACTVLAFLTGVPAVRATSYLTLVSDLLSSSAPGQPTDNTIRFTLTQAIPASGGIDISFAGGGFSIPAALNYTDVDVGFSAAPGGPYTERPLSSVRTAGTDRVVVTSGTVSPKIHIDLNTTAGIPAGNEVRINVGLNAVFGATGDQRTSLTSATGSYPVTITTLQPSGAEIDYGFTRIVAVPQVTIGPVDTTDQTPPTILRAEPAGLLQVGTRGVELFVVTDEAATCKYATTSVAYDAMPFDLTGTSTNPFVNWHFAQELGLTDDTTYTYYVSCADYRDNKINPPYELTFTIGITPGTASTTATSTGIGNGTGSSTATSSCVGTQCTGTGTGSGSGSWGSGSGSSGGDGGGSGGGGSSGTGQGTKLPQASVRINGFAYPGSTVNLLRDGKVSKTIAAGSDGVFSDLTEGLDRGSYTFSVFALDAKGVRSATFATTLWLRSETLNVLSNIMLPPTLSVANASVDPGAPLSVSGYATPGAAVTVWLRPRLAEVSSSDVIATSTAAGNGFWQLTIPTITVPQGTYELVAQAVLQGGAIESDKSARLTVGVGVSVADTSCVSTGDLNCDGFVNLVDFSILLFHWNTSDAVADINADGTVSLPDFSIMLYYWTG